MWCVFWEVRTGLLNIERHRKKKKKTERQKERKKKTENKIYICIYRLTQTSAVTCYVIEPSPRQGELPTTNKTATVLITTKIWSWVPEGLNAKTDGLTVSCKVTLTLDHINFGISLGKYLGLMETPTQNCVRAVISHKIPPTLSKLWSQFLCD